MGRKKGCAHGPRQMSSPVKHGGGDVMAGASMASSGLVSLIFIDVAHQHEEIRTVTDCKPERLVLESLHTCNSVSLELYEVLDY